MKRRFPRKRWIVAATLVLALAAWCAYRTRAPRLRLERYRAELEQRGAHLTLEECAPPPRPGDLAAAREFTGAARSLPASGLVLPLNPPPVMHTIAPGKALVGWAQPRITSSEGSRGTNRDFSWDDLAADLRQAQPLFDQIRQASLADRFDWGLDYRQGFSLLLPHLAPNKQSIQWLAAATQLALHEGRLDDALDLLETQLRIAHNLRDDGLVINQLVRIAMASISFASSWEALQADAWSDSQLERLQQAWENVEFAQAMIRAIELERALGLFTYDSVRRSPTKMQTVMAPFGASPGIGTAASSGDDDVASKVLDWIGHSAQGATWSVRSLIWAKFQSYDDERFYIQTVQSQIDAAAARCRSATGQVVRVEGSAPVGTVNPTPRRELDIEARKHWLASLMIPLLGSAFEKAFLVQSEREMVVSAVALKRFQQLHGEFPEKLEQLVPELLHRVPVDWMDGRPLRYRRTTTNFFVLYSIGKDGKDDGGDPHPLPETPPSTHPYAGRDFVWPEPTGTEESAPGSRPD